MGACKDNLLAQSSPLSAASRSTHTFARSNASGVIFVTYPEAAGEELRLAGGVRAGAPAAASRHWPCAAVGPIGPATGPLGQLTRIRNTRI